MDWPASCTKVFIDAVEDFAEKCSETQFGEVKNGLGGINVVLETGGVACAKSIRNARY